MALSIGQLSGEDLEKTLVLDLSKPNGALNVPSTADDHAKTVILNFSDRSANTLNSTGNSAYEQTVILDLSKPENRSAPEERTEDPKTAAAKIREESCTPPDILDDDYRDIETWIRTIGMKVLGDKKDAPDPERLKLSQLMMGVLTDASDETVFSALFDTSETVRLKLRSEPNDYYGHMKTILYKYLHDSKAFLMDPERILECFELSEIQCLEYEIKRLTEGVTISPEDLATAQKQFKKYSALQVRLESFTEETRLRNPDNPYIIVGLRIVAMIGKLQKRAIEADAKEQNVDVPLQKPGFLENFRNLFSFQFLRWRSE